MPRYDHKGVSFDPPPNWVDRTIVAFAAPVPPGMKNAPNVVMTQEPMREGDTLRIHADRQLMELAKQLHDFDVFESREMLVGGLPAIHMRFSWTTNFGALEQTLTLVERTVDDKRVATTFTTTATTQDAEKLRPVFQEVLKSIRFGAPSAPASLQPQPPSSAPQLPDSNAPVVPMPGYRRR